MFVLPLSRSVTYPANAAPFGHALERLFDAPLDRYFGGSAGGTPSRTPALDVRETDAGYTLAFDVPGVTREQLKVSIEGRRVSIESIDDPATSKTDAAAPDTVANQAAPAAAERVLYRERSTARYARTVSLPAEVDQSASQARFENGVLTLALAKKQPRGATQLSIS
ncbi:MAG: Hsp20/alpha crystallin family protein [Burkholderiaceae bacterium]